MNENLNHAHTLPLPGVINKISSIIKYLTVYQWNEIDKEYKDKNQTFDLKAVAVFCISAFVLLIGYFFTTTNFITGFPKIYALMMSAPYPHLWPYMYWGLATTLNYFLLPCLVIIFVFKEKISQYGFGKVTNKNIYYLYISMFVLVFIAAYFVSFLNSFSRIYPFYKNISSFADFLLWELSYSLQFVGLEFFFRGFLLFALARYMGAYSIFVMILPYTMIHFPKTHLESCAAIIAGIALGTLALRTKSIYGGIVIHIAVAWSMDLFCLWQLDKLGNIF